MKIFMTALGGLMGLLAFTAPGMASPLHLSDNQLDTITAGATGIDVTASSFAGAGLFGPHTSADTFAVALQKGPVGVAFGDGFAFAIGTNPSSNVSITGSGGQVMTNTVTVGAGPISFSGGVGLATSFFGN